MMAPAEGTRVRVVALDSRFFGRTGRVIQTVPEGLGVAHGVLLEGGDATGGAHPMVFYAGEVEALGPEPPALTLECVRCGLPIPTTAEAEEVTHPSGVSGDDEYAHAGGCPASDEGRTV